MSNRCYSEEEFEDAGAVIQDDLSEAKVIFGVKEVPIANLMKDKTYIFFSHTIKAQEYNMPLLDKMLELNIRQIDFECIREATGPKPERLVAFGRFAGLVGAFDFIRGCGEYLLQKSYQTPFVYLGSAYMYEDYVAMCEALQKIAKNISKSGLPRKLGPMVFAVAGNGRVSKGAEEILLQLPHERITPDKLEWLHEDGNWSNKKIYIVTFVHKDLVKRKDGGEFSREHYYANPNEYESVFWEYLQYISFLVQGIYWEPKFPRTLTRDELKEAVEDERCKLMGICDISADYEGSIEMTSRFTSIEEPFLIYDALTKGWKEKIADATGPGDILFHCVDHLPAEMPKEASNYFGSNMLPFVEAIVDSDFTAPWDKQTDLPVEIRNATITANGQLTPNYQYIAELRKKNEAMARQKEEFEREAQNARKDSGLQRSMSSATLQMVGHLFDTKFFNDSLDILEKEGIKFRVVEMHIGNTTGESSSVTIQVMARDASAFNKAIDLVTQLGEQVGVAISEAQSGPSLSKNFIVMESKD